MRISETASLLDFQSWNKEIYLVQNDRSYGKGDIVSRLHRYVTRILKAVRKEQTEHIHYYIGMAFSWSLALANRLHINLDDELWSRFPGVCPYCVTAPCSCKSVRPESRQKSLPLNGQRPDSLRAFQKMFAHIYPNSLRDAVMHLAEEAGEIDEAVEHYHGTHETKYLEEMISELVDVDTNLFAVANCLRLDLASEMVNLFSGGCCKCHQVPCNCNYITPDHPVK